MEWELYHIMKNNEQLFTNAKTTAAYEVWRWSHFYVFVYDSFISTEVSSML